MHVQRLDDLLLGGILADEVALAQHGEHRVALAPGFGVRFFHRLGEKAESLAEVDVVAREIARGRGQVVGVDRREQGLPVVLRRLRTVSLELEPQHGRAQDAARRQILAHPRFDVAEVFADDDGAGAVGFEREHADHRLVVVADVRAGVRTQTGRESTTAGRSR